MKSFTGIFDSVYTLFITKMESVIFITIYIFPKVPSLDEKSSGKIV